MLSAAQQTGTSEVDNSIIQLRQTITQSLQEELMQEAQDRTKVKKDLAHDEFDG